MSELFGSLNLNPLLIKALNKENIVTPTDVQQKAIPELLQNKDVIVRSETGSGKTLAYLLPLYEKINAQSREMQAMVLVPTHELAIQIQRQIELLSQNSGINITGTPIIGNVNIMRQIDKLKEKPHIIVGSSGRILELIKKKKITAHTIKTIILDEADRLMDEHNLENVKAIIKSTLKERQLAAFSATISEAAMAKARELMKEPQMIQAQAGNTVPTEIEHLYFMSEQRDKVDVLRKIVRIINPEKAVVFINKTEELDVITAKMKYHGLGVESIHGVDFKLDRKRTMEAFRSGKIQLLVASDIAARGLDIEGITHIFNLDMPEDPRDYLHRVGRTGRKGNSGVAISIVSERELPLLKKYESVLKINIAFRDMYEGKIIESKKDEFKRSIKQTARNIRSK